MDVPLRLYPRKFHLDRSTVLRHIKRYLSCVGILPDVPQQQQATWLDFGCGSGYGTCLLSNFAQTVHGYDSDSKAIDYAQANANLPGVRYLRKLCSGGCKYDTIFMIEVAEHMQTPELRNLLMDLANYYLAPHGYIVVTTPIVDETGPSKTNPHHVCEYSLDYFTNIIKDLGFTICGHTETVPCTANPTMQQGFFALRREL